MPIYSAKMSNKSKTIMTQPPLRAMFKTESLAGAAASDTGAIASANVSTA